MSETPVTYHVQNFEPCPFCSTGGSQVYHFGGPCPTLTPVPCPACQPPVIPGSAGEVLEVDRGVFHYETCLDGYVLFGPDDKRIPPWELVKMLDGLWKAIHRLP